MWLRASRAISGMRVRMRSLATVPGMRRGLRPLATAMIAALARALRPSAATLTAAHQDRLGLDRRVGFEARNHDLRNLALDQAFDVAQQLVLVDAHQRQRLALGAGAAGAADAVHVVFRHVGQLVVHHVRQLVDVDAARGDVGRHQHPHCAVLEVGQRLGARAPGSCCRGSPWR